MGLIVQKFGGSSVKDRDRIFNVARIVMNTRNAGNDVVVVVSAQGDTTDDLITKAAAHRCGSTSTTPCTSWTSGSSTRGTPTLSSRPSTRRTCRNCTFTRQCVLTDRR